MSYAKAGVSMVEALMALVLGLLVIQLSLGIMARMRRIGGRLTRRAESMEAVRITRHVVGGEVRLGRPGRDWVVVGREELALRAFRGVADVCPWRPDSLTLLVSYRGSRAVDPSKDSVLLADREGTWLAAAVVRVSASGLVCPEAPDVSVERWRMARAAPPGVVLARVFERGSYHLSGGALRYRRGRAGRQPLTPEVLRTPPSGFAWGGGTLRMDVTTEDGDDASRTVWNDLVWRRVR